MFNLKKHSLLILIAMLILILMPMSFAADVDDTNATDTALSITDTDDLEAVNEISEISTVESSNLNSTDNEVLSSDYQYESTVTPNTVDYTKGDSLEVTVTIECDYTYPSAPMYVYINGDSTNDRQVVNGVYGNKNSFTYDLNKISDKLVDGTNILKFHIDESYLTDDWLSDFQYNPLTVNVVTGTTVEPYTGIIYVSTTGNNDNDGSEESPVSTIEKAIELATAENNTEHKIIIDEGSYTMSNAQLDGCDLSIVGIGKVYLAPETGKYHMYLGGSNTYEFENLIFVNGTQSTSVISMSTSKNKKVTIKNCSFIGNVGYSYIIASTGQVTITNCNFINNTVKAGSSGGMIYANDGKLEVSYSNFLNNKNTGSSGYSDIAGYSTSDGWDVSYRATITAENNYWGSNSGPASTQIDKDNIGVTKYVKLIAEVDGEEIISGNSYDVILKFTDKSGNELSTNMPDLEVALSAEGTVTPSTVTISENTATATYTAPSEAGTDTIHVKYDENSLTSRDITISAPEPEYVSTPSVDGGSSVEFTKGSTGVIVSVEIVSDKLEGFFDPYGDAWYVDAYIDGVACNLELKDASEGSFTFDLAVLDDQFEVGKVYNITFRPPKSAFGEYGAPEFDNSVFNNLTVTVLAAPEPEYVSTPSVDGSSSVEFTKGSTGVTVVVTITGSGDISGFYEASSYSDCNFYAFIDGSDEGIYLENVKATESPVSFDLSVLDQYLEAGKKYNITFHPPKDDFGWYNNPKWDNSVFNNLTVTVLAAPEPEYVSTPAVDGNNTVEYLINDHVNVVVTIDSDLLDQFESYDKLYAWIGDTYKEINVMANEASFTVDLKDLSDKFNFEEGQTYVIYFHPDINTLNSIGINEGEYVFNPLTVEIIGTYNPEPVVVYNSTPKVNGKSSIEYTIGEDAIVTVTILYDESYGTHDGFKDKHMRVFINDDTTGIVISDVDANATTFTINLADYIEAEGEYNISFTPGDSVLSWVFNGIDNAKYEINNLTVKASAPEAKPTYNLTADASIVDYTIGDDKIITVTIKYDSEYANANIPVHVYIDDGEGIVINNVKANASSFTINLADYITSEGEHNITFHPNVTELTNIADGEYNFTNVKVNAIKSKTLITPEVEVTTNKPAVGENAVITVKVPENATGNVTITVGKNAPETVKLSKGIATLTVPNLAIGEYNVTVIYNGDENYTQATKNATLTVSKKEVVVDNNTFTIPDDTNSPTYSINLPSNATGYFTVSVDGKDNYTEKLVNGSASITLTNLTAGKHNIVISYSGDGNYSGISKNTTLTVPEPVIKLSNNKDINMLYSANAVYKVLITVDGKAIGAGESVIVKFNGATKTLKTDKDGYISYKIPTVKPKKAKYVITATYKGQTVQNMVKVNSIIKATNKKVKKSKKVTKVKVTLKKVNAKFLKGKTIKIKFKGKTYKVKTNKKGVAIWKVKKSMIKKLKVGKKYKYKVTYGKDTVTKKLTIKR